MTGTPARALVSLVLAGFAGPAGCVRMEPGLGFDEVRAQVAERVGSGEDGSDGASVHWNNGSKEDAEAAEAVARLLSRELTADAAVQVALLNNRELQAVYEELHIAQAEVVQAGLLRNPIFGGEIRWATTGSEGPAVVLDLTQDFVSLLAMPLAKGRAGAAFEAAKLRVTAAVVSVAAEVRSAFYEHQAAEQMLELRRSVLEAAGASLELARRIREAGNSRELDLLRERSLAEEARMDVAHAEEELAQSRERLNVLMGAWGKQTMWRATPRLAEVPEEPGVPDDVERLAVERSLELSIDRREIEVAARAVGIADPFGWLMDSEVGVAAERDLDGTWSVGPSVSIPVPLFDQGQGAVGRAQAQLRQASERYYARAVSVRSSARAAASLVRSSGDRARYHREVLLPLHERIVEETQLQYNGMQVSAFELLEARRGQIEAGAEYIESLRDYWVARARLERMLGGRLDSFERGAVASDPEGPAGSPSHPPAPAISDDAAVSSP